VATRFRVVSIRQRRNEFDRLTLEASDPGYAGEGDRAEKPNAATGSISNTFGAVWTTSTWPADPGSEPDFDPTASVSAIMADRTRFIHRGGMAKVRCPETHRQSASRLLFRFCPPNKPVTGIPTDPGFLSSEVESYISPFLGLFAVTNRRQWVSQQVGIAVSKEKI